MQQMQKRLYFLNNFLFIIQALIKTFIIDLIYLIKYALQQNRKLLSLFYRNEASFKQGNTNMTTFTFIKSAVASEIMQLPEICFDYRQDNEQALLDHIEAHGYCQPSEIGTTAEAYDIVWSDLARNTDYEMPDFSMCRSSLECIEAEAQAILNGAYNEATQEIANQIASAIDECFNYNFGELELTEMYIGKSGLGHVPHDYETDIADSSMLVWVKYKKVQITVEGVTLYGILEQVED